MINVVIADDHDVVIKGILTILESYENIHVVASVLNGKEAISVLEKNPIDIAILDINMPELDGVETALIIKKKFPKTKVLMLTMYNEFGYIRKLIDANVEGYILKNKVSDELVDAIHTIVMEDDIFFGKEVTKTLVKGAKSKYTFGEVKFTNREKEVLKLIANGKSTPKISKALNIADSTVETHRRNLIEKAGVDGTKGLIKFAVENGLD